MAERWLYLAALLWVACAFFDLWFILALLKGDVFDRWSKQIHVAQFVGIWSLSALITLIPFFVEGTSAYSNSFLTFANFGFKGSYYFAILPFQLALAPLWLLLPHLVYTLRKRVQRLSHMYLQRHRIDILY